MPELPEVETVARGIDARVRGRAVTSVWFSSKPEPFRSAPETIAAVLTGSTIQRAHRVGKHIVVDLALAGAKSPRRKSTRAVEDRNEGARTAQWLIHLGMTGQLLVAGPDTPLAAHTHAVLQLDDGREIRFVDPRRFGRLSVIHPQVIDDPSGRNGAATLAGKFAGKGQEPLGISAEAFRELFRGRQAPIKSALLNQSLLQGVGNIYADESLFRAGIRPRRRAHRLMAGELSRLRTALQSVLREAIAAGGSSVSDYVDADGERGFFQLRHRVYRRTGKPCLVCGTPITRILLGGRGTHFCRICQR
jgi:formamidopyrimidine-DNA glycosylase